MSNKKNYEILEEINALDIISKEILHGSIIGFKEEDVIIRFYLDEGDFDRKTRASTFKRAGITKEGQHFNYIISETQKGINIEIEEYSAPFDPDVAKIWDEFEQLI